MIAAQKVCSSQNQNLLQLPMSDQTSLIELGACLSRNSKVHGRLFSNEPYTMLGIQI